MIPSYTIVKDDNLVKRAANPKQGRHFWTGGRFEDAETHLKAHPNDVCMVRLQGKEKIVLLGGPIPRGPLLDVTGYNFSDFADSFDVGEMTSLVDQWFQTDFQKQVTVNILESGAVIDGLGPNTKLISLSRKTPALLDMAATENGELIGQYVERGVLGHSGDCHSTIGGVACLHHELTMRPSASEGTKLYFLVGYNSKPLKAWRDSRVFWIVYDSDQEICWLVPHDLSHSAVGDTVSATMPLVSKSTKGDNNEDTISVIHISGPVHASLETASPLRPTQTSHRAFIKQCMDAANVVDWEAPATASSDKSAREELSDRSPVPEGAIAKTATTSTVTPMDRAIACFDDCSDTLFEAFPQLRVAGNGSVSLSPMHGPLKVLASSCCANSRVVAMDGGVTMATSEVNSVYKQLSGIIFVKMANNPDVYKLHQIRWNMARAPRTPVLALTSDGCKHLCGPLPPCYEDEDYPTPVAGTPISNEAVVKIIEFAFSTDGDKYFGPLYQAVPSPKDAEGAIAAFIAEMEGKDFGVIRDDGKDESDESELEAPFTDNDFRRLMEVINMLSVSTSTAVERNNMGIRIVKFLHKMSKRTAHREIQQSLPLQKHSTELELLGEWTGENLDWAMGMKDVLESILKGSNVNIAMQEGIEVDLALQAKLDEAIKKKKSQLNQTIRALKSSTLNSWKKTFNAVFHPALEAIMRSIGDNPRYKNFFPEVKLPNMAGVIIRASQSSNKQAIASNPEAIMKIFHTLGATGFISFKIDFLQTWKAKVINEICLVDRPGEGFNNPETFVPTSHRLEDGPTDPVAAYETDVRHHFVLPTFARLPKMIDSEDDSDDDEDTWGQMPVAPAEDELAKYLLMRAEFMLRDPEQGPRQPMWQYVDWLFHQIKTIHQVPEKQAAPLAMRALGFSISRLMRDKPNPDQETMETVASIIQAISFMSARGDPLPHGCLDSFFNMGTTYVPTTKDMERNPWQIEVVNILSRAVDYVCPIMSTEEYVQIRSNFQRAAANVVKRQIVQKLLDHKREETKKHQESHEDYVARVNNEFYPAYREIVETIRMLLDADPATFQLTDELRKRIQTLHDTIVVKWAKSKRTCRVGPVREMAKILHSFSERGGEEAMAYLVGRKPHLEYLYDVVYHIKYESCDQVLVKEVCLILNAKTRNPKHDKHEKWQSRVDRAMEDVSTYDLRMSGFAHGHNQYKRLPTELMLGMLQSLKANPASNKAVTFADVQSLLAHVNIEVAQPEDLKAGVVLERLRGEWWMCPDIADASENTAVAFLSKEQDAVPSVALIPMGMLSRNGSASSSNILATLGDTYHEFQLARLFSGRLQPMRNFLREHYKFHLEWFEDTIRAAGFPHCFDAALVKENDLMAIYAIVQRLVHELVEDGADRGDGARDRVYGPVVVPNNTSSSSDRLGNME